MLIFQICFQYLCLGCRICLVLMVNELVLVIGTSITLQLDLSHIIYQALSYRFCCQPLRLVSTLSSEFPESIESTVFWYYLQTNQPRMLNRYQTMEHSADICLSRRQ